MQFYAYIPSPDGIEPMGTANRAIIRDLKTVKGAINRLKRFPRWNSKPFLVFTFSNFYDQSTFKQVYKHSI